MDESSFPKKGKYYAGVSRQYYGQRGKVDNCQVGVFGALSTGSLVNLVQANKDATGICSRCSRYPSVMAKAISNAGT